MSEVYVVFQKQYDGEHIVEIASSEDKAKEICSSVQSSYEPAYIIPYKVV